MVKEYLQLALDCSAIWTGFQILLLAPPGSKYPSCKFSYSLGHHWFMSVPSILNHQVSSKSRCGIGNSADDDNDRLLVRLRTKTSLDQQTCLQRTQSTALPGRERLGEGWLYLSRLLAMLAGYFPDFPVVLWARQTFWHFQLVTLWDNLESSRLPPAMT